MVALDSFYPVTGVVEAQADWIKFGKLYRSDGVVKGGGGLNDFAVSQRGAGANMSVDVATGQCFLQGIFGENGSIKNLAIAAADATNARIDRVVLRLDTSVPNIQVLVTTGTPAGSPSAPALTRSGTQTDYSLSQVQVAALATSITTANCSPDERTWSTSPGYTRTGNVASATAVGNIFGITPLLPAMLIVPITGVTTITSICASNMPPAGSVLILEFAGALTVTSGSNLSLTRNYVTTSGSRLMLYSDGTNWIEISRSLVAATDLPTVTQSTITNTVSGAPPTTASNTLGALTGGDAPAITTTGGDVLIIAVLNGSCNVAGLRAGLQITWDGTLIGVEHRVTPPVPGEFSMTAVAKVAAPAAGSHTAAIAWRAVDATLTVTAFSWDIYALELKR